MINVSFLNTQIPLVPCRFLVSLQDVQVDQGGLAPPVLVDIAPQIRGKLNGLKETSTMQLIVGRGLVRIDRQGGPYDDGKTLDNDDDSKHK